MICGTGPKANMLEKYSVHHKECDQLYCEYFNVKTHFRA